MCSTTRARAPGYMTPPLPGLTDTGRRTRRTATPRQSVKNQLFRDEEEDGDDEALHDEAPP